MSVQEQDFVTEHAALIGRVAIAWNDLNYILSYLFERFSVMPSDRAAAVYFSLKSDATQRELLMAVAKIALAPHPDILQSFKDCMGQINALAGERNAAMHTSWAVAVSGDRFVPAPQIPTHRALKPDFAAQFQSLRERLTDQYLALNEVRKAFEKTLGH
ncbi:MAG: hypothetical protein ACLPTZ_28870 [Beijerinckiaceae bacterium]